LDKYFECVAKCSGAVRANESCEDVPRVQICVERVYVDEMMTTATVLGIVGAVFLLGWLVSRGFDDIR
jgi:hypothetical protein